MKGYGDPETASLGFCFGSLMLLMGFTSLASIALLPDHPFSMLEVGMSCLALAGWMLGHAWGVIGGMEGLDAWAWSHYLDKLTRKAVRSAPGPCTCLLIEPEATEWICIHHGRVWRDLSGYNRAMSCYRVSTCTCSDCTHVRITRTPEWVTYWFASFKLVPYLASEKRTTLVDKMIEEASARQDADLPPPTDPDKTLH